MELNKWRWFEKIGYTPHEGQRECHQSKARIKVVCAGARWGKSLFAAREAEPVVLTPDKRVWIVAPNYGLGEKEFRYMITDIMSTAGIKPVRWADNKNTGQMYMEFYEGKMASFVRVMSAENPESLLGEELDLIVLSEGAHIPRDVFENKLWPRLMTRKGRVIIPTTPAGSDDFLAPLWEEGQDPKNHSRVQSWQFPTWGNPLIDKEEVEAARGRMSKEHFAEQVEGKFVKYSGAVYGEFDVNFHVIPHFTPDKSWRRECGLDFGSTNPFVCLWAAFDYDGNMFVYDEYYKAGDVLVSHAAAIKSKTGDQPIDVFWADPSAAQERMELSSHGIITLEAVNEVPIGIERVRQMLRVNPVTGKPRLFIMDNCVELIKEFPKYHYKPIRHGLNADEMPVKKNDHCLDGLRYIISGSPMATEKVTERIISPFSDEGIELDIARNERSKRVIGNQFLRG